MGRIIEIIKMLLTSSEARWRYLFYTPVGKMVSDEFYLKKMYKDIVGKELDLDNPKTFNEKLQWLKIHDRNPLYTTMVDKYEVRNYIKEKIGEEYLIPLVGGPWDRFDDIDFDKLPNQFVLKATHDSGGVIICKDKETFDISAAKAKLEKSLKQNFYYAGREWPYKNVKPRIIAEKFMVDNNIKGDIIDYKFFCFNGDVKFLYVSQGLEDHQTASISFVTLDWEKEKFKRLDYKDFQTLPNKPVNFEKMIELSKVLCKDIPFIRVDFYEINEKIYFSELTFFPAGGMIPFEPKEYDGILGDLIELPINN